MSEKNNIKIRDFDLFVELAKSTSKIIKSAKFIINQNGIQVYGVSIENSARCELQSNAIYSDKELTFAIEDISKFLKILQTIQQIHEKDYSDFSFNVILPQLTFSSKKFKTKLNTIDEEKISKWISKKIETKLTPVFEFNTTQDFVKRLLGHTFVFGDNQKDIRVYLETKQDMEKNALFATLGNKENNLNNEITLKFGLVTFGSLNNRNLIVDVPRLQVFNAFPTNEIKISLMDMNVLVSKSTLIGKNDSWFNLNLYTSILKN